MFRIQEEFKVSRGSRFKVKRGFRVVSYGFRVVSGGWKKKSSRFEEVQGLLIYFMFSDTIYILLLYIW